MCCRCTSSCVEEKSHLGSVAKHVAKARRVGENYWLNNSLSYSRIEHDNILAANIHVFVIQRHYTGTLVLFLSYIIFHGTLSCHLSSKTPLQDEQATRIRCCMAQNEEDYSGIVGTTTTTTTATAAAMIKITTVLVEL